MKERLSITAYGMEMARTAARRSEDPHCAVGAVALTSEDRIIATAYNGLCSGMHLTESQWMDRDFRRQYVIHAEQNLCALFKRGEVLWVCITLSPCLSCLKQLSASGVREVVYSNEYSHDPLPPVDVIKQLGIEVIRYNI
jgi:dCMP deaminase